MKTNETVPEFKSLEEEKAYWREQADGCRWRHQPAREGKPISHVLSVRFSGEEMSQLAELARSHNLGVSTYSRQLVLGSIKSGGQLRRQITSEELLENIDHVLTPDLSRRLNRWFDSLTKGDSPCLDLDKVNSPDVQKILVFLTALTLSCAGVDLVPSPSSPAHAGKGMATVKGSSD